MNRLQVNCLRGEICQEEMSEIGSQFVGGAINGEDDRIVKYFSCNNCGNGVKIILLLPSLSVLSAQFFGKETIKQ